MVGGFVCSAWGVADTRGHSGCKAGAILEMQLAISIDLPLFHVAGVTAGLNAMSLSYSCSVSADVTASWSSKTAPSSVLTGNRATQA